MLAVALLAVSVPAQAQAAGPLTERTEKLKFETKKGKSFLQPGFALGEYSGLSRQSATTTSALGLYGSTKSKAEISVTSPSLGAVTIKCKGGESRTALGWITFDRDKLAYVCTFEGAGPEAAFTLVQSKGGLMARLQTPQRAAELRLGAVTLRAESKQVGAARRTDRRRPRLCDPQRRPGRRRRRSERPGQDGLLAIQGRRRA